MIIFFAISKWNAPQFFRSEFPRSIKGTVSKSIRIASGYRIMIWYFDAVGIVLYFEWLSKKKSLNPASISFFEIHFFQLVSRFNEDNFHKTHSIPTIFIAPVLFHFLVKISGLDRFFCRLLCLGSWRNTTCISKVLMFKVSPGIPLSFRN